MGNATFKKDDTFVTGGGLPGRNKTAAPEEEQLESSEEEDYENLEDKLLADVERHEKDFKAMMKYLNEVDGMMHGNDLKYIREMIGYSRKTMGNHMLGYNKIKDSVFQMGDEAISSMEGASKWDKQAAGFVNKAKKGTERLKGQLVEVPEEPVVVEEPEGMRMGPMTGQPLERQKLDIVQQLIGMNGSMKNFSGDIE